MMTLFCLLFFDSCLCIDCVSTSRADEGCVTSVMLSRDRCKDYRKSAKQQPELFSGGATGLLKL